MCLHTYILEWLKSQTNKQTTDNINTAGKAFSFISGQNFKNGIDNLGDSFSVSYKGRYRLPICPIRSIPRNLPKWFQFMCTNDHVNVYSSFIQNHQDALQKLMGEHTVIWPQWMLFSSKTNELVTHPTIWMDLKCILQSKRNLSEKAAFYKRQKYT